VLINCFTSSDNSSTDGFMYTLITSPSCCNVSSNDFSYTRLVTVSDGSDITGFDTDGDVGPSVGLLGYVGLVGLVGLVGDVVSPEFGVSPG
jgi:hypothetical protein